MDLPANPLFKEEEEKFSTDQHFFLEKQQTSLLFCFVFSHQVDSQDSLSGLPRKPVQRGRRKMDFFPTILTRIFS